MDHFLKELMALEELIRDGYFGEARFLTRRILLEQKQQQEAGKRQDPGFIAFLDELQHKLLMHESWSDVQRILHMVQQARQPVPEPEPTVVAMATIPSGRQPVTPKHFSGRNLYHFLKMPIRKKG